MSQPPFVHLHCHSHYSLLDGAGKVQDLVHRAKELGMNSLALTDHGNLYGAIEFYETCQEIGIKPILGYEAYIAPGCRRKKGTSMKEASYHLTLLAQNRTGFKNLLKLTSEAYVTGFYYRPRIDKDLLAQHSEGVICLSGCASGELSRLVRAENETAFQQAMEAARWYRELFGDRYFIEIQDNGEEVQRIANAGNIRIARELDIPLVATSDVHYVYRENHEAQDILICINTGKFRTDTKRMKMGTDQYYLRSPEEMYAVMPDHADAVARTQEIAESVDIDLKLGERYFPVFTPPDDKEPIDYLRELCLRGLKRRYADNPKRYKDGVLSEEVMARLNRELSVIEKLGFANYFIIVWDFVRVAEERGIQRTARGSGVGALVCYALDMSHVCPLEFDLLFERFLDESRLEAPDIDIDFDQQRRSEILDYVKETYGIESVAQIGTFGTLAAKMAIRDVGRTLGLPLPLVNEVTSKVPEAPKMTIAKAMKQSEDLVKIYESNPEVRELIDYARQCEGLARSAGTHACAVVISNGPLTDYLPLQCVSGKEDLTTQWSGPDVEKAGLLKMDFLGLRNLTILANAIDIIEETTGERIDPYKFSLDDRETFALLCRGETKGIFQLEGGGIRELLKRMKPDSFHDIIATLALYRPGPLEGGMVDQYVEVKHGRKKAEYPHEVMEEVLTETHGVMVYQEQVMRILNRLGGIPLSESYKCIKAIGKKKLKIIEEYKSHFVEGTQKSGLTEKKAIELFEMIEKFAGYGFNKSHSTAYALVAYMTAYLKAHYPVEFMASLLTGDLTNRNFTRKDSTVEHLEDCQRMNIVYVAPDVNHSNRLYKVRDGKIFIGMAAIKACSATACDAIVAAREKDGAFTSLFDFCERVDPQQCGKSAIETLIKAGAFDSLGARRSQLFAVIERAVKGGQSAAKQRRSGQRSLFADMDEDKNEAADAAAAALPDIPEWDEREKLAGEKEVLGFYLSSHPLAEFQKDLATFCSHTTSEACRLPNRADVMIGGMISAVALKTTKNPKPDRPSRYAMFDMEDHDSMMRCIMWPEQYALYGHLVTDDAILIAVGKVDKSRSNEDDDANLIIDELLTFEEARERLTQGAVIRVSERDHGEQGMQSLYEIIRGYPGEAELQLVAFLDDGTRVPMRCRQRIEINPEMQRRVEELLGPGNFKLMPKKHQPRANSNNNGRRQYSRAS